MLPLNQADAARAKFLVGNASLTINWFIQGGVKSEEQQLPQSVCSVILGAVKRQPVAAKSSLDLLRPGPVGPASRISDNAAQAPLRISNAIHPPNDRRCQITEPAA